MGDEGINEVDLNFRGICPVQAQMLLKARHMQEFIQDFRENLKQTIEGLSDWNVTQEDLVGIGKAFEDGIKEYGLLDILYLE